LIENVLELVLGVLEEVGTPDHQDTSQDGLHKSNKQSIGQDLSLFVIADVELLLVLLVKTEDCE